MKFRSVLSLLVLLSLVTGCNPAGTPTAAPTQPPAQLQKVVLGMGYVPSVQFAPFYVAQDKGYYAAEGLDVEFRFGVEADMMKLVGTDEVKFVIGSGDQVILARSHDLPVVYVMHWYRRFPVTVFALKSKGLDSPKKLEGHKVGISMLSGASYVAWKALVYAGEIDESKVDLEVTGFTQAAAVSQGRVDAALDYISNGPAQLKLAKQDIDIIHISDYVDLVSNGIITNEKTIAENPELVRKVVQATLRGLKDTLDDPDAAFATCRRYIPDIKDDTVEKNRVILEESMSLWRTEGLGLSDRASWETSARFMYKMGFIEKEVKVDDLFTNRFVE